MFRFLTASFARDHTSLTLEHKKKGNDPIGSDATPPTAGLRDWLRVTAAAQTKRLPCSLRKL